MSDSDTAGGTGVDEEDPVAAIGSTEIVSETLGFIFEIGPVVIWNIKHIVHSIQRAYKERILDAWLVTWPELVCPNPASCYSMSLSVDEQEGHFDLDIA